MKGTSSFMVNKNYPVVSNSKYHRIQLLKNIQVVTFYSINGSFIYFFNIYLLSYGDTYF